MHLFVGRAEPLARLVAAYDACCGSPTPPAGGAGPWSGLCVVPGPSGSGKTVLVRRFAEEADARGALVVWGTCWDAEQAPAWWPWTQALRSLVERVPALRDGLAPELVPLLGGHRVDTEATAVDPQDTSVRARVLLAVADLLGRAASDRPVVVVLDDLQWGDSSTLELLRFLARHPQQSRVLVVAAYRSDELRSSAGGDLADIAASSEMVPLQALRAADVRELVAAVAGGEAAEQWGDLVHRRSEGHPLFARELAHLVATGDPGTGIPHAVRDAVLRRVERLSSPCREVLDAAAVAGRSASAPLLAEVCGATDALVAAALAEAGAAGILAAGELRPAFAHDLYRETVYQQLAGDDRTALHHAVGRSLAAPGRWGREAFASEVARHFTASVAVAGADLALAWSHAAARADAARFAFADAAAHLQRARTAIADAGTTVGADALVELLVEEADLLVRGGRTGGAREVLDEAWGRAVRSGEGAQLSRVALGLVSLGARFATPRTELVRVLEQALLALEGTGTTEEAEVTAALARQLQHSVPADRPRAAPLAQRAVAIARDLDDPHTLTSCLLAAHDVLWTPGAGPERAEIAAQIADVARRTSDGERLAQALLLLANAQLETGSPAFRATLAESLLHTDALHEPRQDYVALTRRAAVTLLDGDLEAGDWESRAAEELGLRCGDTDTGNVRMSQRLEIVRAGGDPRALSELAREAVDWWVGAPVHAHAIAAGFHARAGDLKEARRELDVVVALDWRTDRSYLWSVFVGEIATAAIAVGDAELCRQVLEDLRPLAGSCAVNGALVCFMGSHELTIGRLLAALGDPVAARDHLIRAVEVHRRLGASLWEQESRGALEALGSEGGRPVLHRTGDLWEVRYGGRTAVVRDTKGMRDLSALIARPGEDIPAAELTGHDVVRDPHGAPVLDRTALAAYRDRLAELDDELEEARADADLGRGERAATEREAILGELRSQTRPDGSSRGLGATTVERSRKAVSARIRDAIARVAESHPELGAHLDLSIRTGTSCRYEP